MNVNGAYKSFLAHKIKSKDTYKNLAKKIKNTEDLKYTLGLVWFGCKHIFFKPKIDNEKVRGR